MQKLLVRMPLILGAMAIILQGCLPASRSEAARLENETGSVLYTDDFSDPPSGWGTWKRGGALVEYHAGGLRIRVDETHYDFWSVSGQNFTDARIEVDAAMLDGPSDNDFGIICRYQDRDNFYMLVVSSDGYYGAAKLKNGLYRMIGTDQLQYSSVITQGQATNRVRADCVGDVLSLYVNGQKLLEVRDGDFQDGDVGLIAGSYAIKGVDILFDNFVVKEPGQEPSQ